MGAPKPCEGYSSRTAAVIALIREGLDLPAIAIRLGVPRTVISADLLTSVRPGQRVQLRTALRPAAEARGITPEQLAARLLVVLATEPTLIDAVLDDRPRRAGEAA